MDAAQLKILMQEGLVSAEQLQQVTQVTRSGDLCSELTRLGWLSAEQARRVRQLASAAEDELPLMPHAPAAFQVDRLLGKGGMGEVYAVRDRRMGREAALKLISTEDLRPELVQRFAREARTLAQLNHPGIPAVYEFGLTQSRQPYLLMALIRGRTLSNILIDMNNQGSVYKERQRLLDIFLKICDTVAAAHSKEIIHRDLKPENIMIGDCGEVFVMDWGLTRKREAVGALSNSQIATQKVSLTQAGAILGTLGYMSPEQANGETVEFEADVYSLGSILFELMSGEPAIPQAAPFEMMQRTIQGRFPRLRELDPTQSAELEDIIARAMVTDPGRRTATVALLASQLREWRDSQAEPRALPSKSPWIFALTLILTTVLIAMAWTRQERGRMAANDERRSQELSAQKLEIERRGVELSTQSKKISELSARAESALELLGLYRELPKLGFATPILDSKLNSLRARSLEDAELLHEIGALAMRLRSLNPDSARLASQSFIRSLELNPKQLELYFYLDQLQHKEPLGRDCAERVLRAIQIAQPGFDSDEEDPFFAFLKAISASRSDPLRETQLRKARDFPVAVSWASLELAAIHRGRGELDEARRYEREALLADSSNASVWRAISVNERARGCNWIALAYETAALDFDEQPQALLDHALRLFGQSNLKDHSSEIFRWVKEQLERARKINENVRSPQQVELQRAIAARLAQWTLSASNQRDEAFASFQKLLPIRPGESHLLTVRAFFEYSAQRYDLAQQCYRESISARLADCSWSYFGLLDSLIKLQRYELAAELARDAQSFDPLSIPLGIHSVSALRLANQLEESEALARRLLDRDASNVNIMIECARVQFARQKFAAAARTFASAFEASGFSDLHAFEGVANAYFQENKDSEALNFIRRNNMFKNQAAHALGLEAYALLLQRREIEAVDALALATALAPENLQNQRFYADGLYRLKRYEESLKVTVRVLERAPKDSEILFLKADALGALERIEDAKEVLDFLDSKDFPEDVRARAQEQRSKLPR